MARKAESGNLYFGLVLASVALGAGIAVGRGPWLMWKEQQKRAERQVAIMRDSERTRETLVREEARLRSPVGREEQARDNGWLLPNERPAEASAPLETPLRTPLRTPLASKGTPVKRRLRNDP